MKITSKAPTQRQLKVGEEIKHILSSIFMANTHCQYHADLSDMQTITVSEVRVSPDLKRASVYVMPLGGGISDDYIKSLNEIAPKIRYLMNKKLVLKFSPVLSFKHDYSYDEASKINSLLHSVKDKNEDTENEPEDL